jgi:hypothetical protein
MLEIYNVPINALNLEKIPVGVYLFILDETKLIPVKANNNGFLIFALIILLYIVAKMNKFLFV